MILIAGIFIICQLMAILVNNELLVPAPFLIVQAMYNDLSTPLFYKSISFTLFRLSFGLLIAFVLAISLCFLAIYKMKLRKMIDQCIRLISSIPNISFIIIILIWFGSETSLIIITVLVMFPTIYAQCITAMDEFDEELSLVILEHAPNPKFVIREVYFPYLKPYIISSIKTALSIGTKSTVMAEVLSQVKTGVGKQIQFARFNLDMVRVFSWTIWVVLLVYAFNKLMDLIIRRIA